MDYDSLGKLLKYAGDDEETKKLAESILDTADKAARIVQKRADTNDRENSYTASENSPNPIINAEDEKELIQQISDNSLGVVLTGGGAKGAYQIGVWKALVEKGVFNIAAVSGTSVGAINAALMAGSDLETSEKLWSNLNSEDFLTDIPGDNKLQFSRDGLRRLITESGILDTLSKSKVLCQITCFNSDTGYVEYHYINHYAKDDIICGLLASSAIPVIYGSTKFKEASYYDGGFPLFGQNTPIIPLYEAKIRRFIVIHLSTFKAFRNKKEKLKLNRKILGESFYDNAEFIHIFPSESLGSLISGTLNFDKNYIKKAMELGYKDGLMHADKIKELTSKTTIEREHHFACGKTYRSFDELFDKDF